MGDKRSEFRRQRKQWMKDHGWKGFVCARCGHFSKSVNLHHIQELLYGGENIPENLIPLCDACHREWDIYPKDYPFEHFLVSMPGMVLPISQEMLKYEGAEIFSTGNWLGFCASIYRSVNLAKTSHVLEDEGLTASDYVYEQNEFFSKYPYSDESWRAEQLRQVYGDFSPVVNNGNRA